MLYFSIQNARGCHACKAVHGYMKIHTKSSKSAYLLGTPSPFRVSPAWYGPYSHDYDLVPCSTGLEGVTKE